MSGELVARRSSTADAVPETVSRPRAPWSVDDDRLDLTTIGVDVGSATCQLVVSRVTVERSGGRYVAVASQVVHPSAVAFTPYLPDGAIDGGALASFFSSELQAAGLSDGDVDSGVVILTGAALERRNARAVGDALAVEAGELVSVAAGDHLESVLAAYGSGAVALSRTSGVVLNVDIGGGTTKFAVCEAGRVREVTAIDVGSRLVAWDREGIVVRVERAAAAVAARIGADVAVGRRIEPSTARSIASALAGAVTVTIAGGPDDPLSAMLRRMPPLAMVDQARSVVLSGGVGELVHLGTSPDFGDLGPLLAESLATRLPLLDVPVARGSHGIRATVIGASQYSVQVSGPTVYAERDILPLRNLGVVSLEPGMFTDAILGEEVARSVEAGVTRFDGPGGASPVAVFVPWRGSATPERLEALADALAAGLRRVIDRQGPVVVVCDRDVGAIVGGHLRDRVRADVPVAVLDGVELRDFDYVDIGWASGSSITVTIKSLLFPEGAGAPRQEGCR